METQAQVLIAETQTLETKAIIITKRKTDLVAVRDLAQTLVQAHQVVQAHQTAQVHQTAQAHQAAQAHQVVQVHQAAHHQETPDQAQVVIPAPEQQDQTTITFNRKIASNKLTNASLINKGHFCA